MISVSHLIRKKLKTEDIILENSSESLDLGSNKSYLYVRRARQQQNVRILFIVDHIQEKVSLETRSELLDVSGE